MLRSLLFCVFCTPFLHAAGFTDQRISAVEGVPPSLPLETRAGDLFDASKIAHDVHTLWRSGRVSDIRVETVPEDDSMRVIFRLTPRQTVRVRRIRLDPPTPAVHVELEPDAEMDLRDAQQVAAGVVKQLESSGYPHARAEAQLAPAGPGTADLKIHIEKQRPIDVADVTIAGDPGMRAGDVYRALKATRAKTMLPRIPGIWKGWRVRPGYSSDAVQSDLANLRSLYYRRGYFDADVRIDAIELNAGQAHIGYAVQAGPQYRVPVDAVCRELFDERRAAERAGELDFAARLEVRGEGRRAQATTEITAGPSYRTGRMEFRGNHHVREESLRRMLLLDEGAPLDQALLRQSLARLNRTGWFEPLTESSVILNAPDGASRADVTIALKEKKTRSWYFSGPVGPMSIGGSLRLAIGTRLPPWGQGLLELSTYTLSLNLMLFPKPIGALIPFLPKRRFLPLATLDRPLLPGQALLSGFTIAPQLGWQGMVAGYGVSQTRTRLLGWLQSGRVPTPDLLVTIAHDGHEGTLRCEPPKARFERVRQIAGAAVNVLSSFSPL